MSFEILLGLNNYKQGLKYDNLKPRNLVLFFLFLLSKHQECWDRGGEFIQYLKSYRTFKELVHGLKNRLQRCGIY